MKKLNEELAQITDVLSLLDKGRATTKDFEEFATALMVVVKTFIDASKEEKEAFMDRVEKQIKGRLDRIKDGENGKDGKDGRDGKDGSDGVDGLNGKDADPDEIAALVLSMLPEEKEYLGEDFRNGLEALPEGDKLSISAIEGLEEELKKIRKVTGGQVYGASPSAMLNTMRHEEFSMDGATTVVTLQHGVAAQGHAVVALRYQGQTLDFGTQYTVNGNQITLTFTPENGTIISVTYFS
jgi:hypothetical protein